MTEALKCPKCEHPFTPTNSELSKYIKDVYTRGFNAGFAEGEAKQAIVDLHGRDRFLKELKRQ